MENNTCYTPEGYILLAFEVIPIGQKAGKTLLHADVQRIYGP